MMARGELSILDEGAIFDADRPERFRYGITRLFLTGNRGTVVFCLLNPSTADATKNDPTIRRCIGFAQAWGFSRLIIVNLWALRSTNPRALYHCEDPLGPENDFWIGRAATFADLFICAWGVHGSHQFRGKTVSESLRFQGKKLHHLGLTKDGYPRHPLYLSAATMPVEWAA